MFRIRRSAVRLCQRGETLCPRGDAGSLSRGQGGSARQANRCRPETSSWRTPQTPVNQGTRPKQFRGHLQISACTETNLNAHYCRTSPWLRPNGNPQVNPALLRGGPGWPLAHVQPLLRGLPGWPGVPPLLRSPGARGLCSGKSRPTQDIDPSPEQNESQGSSVHVPGHGLFKFKELHENPWTVPNLLCVCRIVLSPYLGYLIIHQHFYLSLALFTMAGATDMLDGYIARTWPNQKSALGSALDPLADKILISVLYASLTYAQLIPAPLTALVIFRDIGLIAAVFWVRYKTVPPPVTLSKFFNPCYTTAQLKPTLFSKVNTAIQLLLVAASLAAPVFKYTDSLLLQSLWYVTAVTTAASGYSYWHYGRKTVQVLNTKSP
ncbi:cardiolipin synthase (CMP-forming)-like [Gadus chalcogrammus]|uniref:cardiolipin synthase (CMP-forming) n=1 Tax=Gadus chalcogrammus TaxID=1042646 RepID=UPI0024C480D5|nr:cardiolipin synthase (CMP-forming) [Gadus chalcogrammus]XP_056465098.1 cardiolipin synthase (CMP-forming)-like [Gadus chalcogrammus]